MIIGLGHMGGSVALMHKDIRLAIAAIFEVLGTDESGPAT